MKQLNDSNPFFTPWSAPRDEFYANVGADPELALHITDPGFVEILDYIREDPAARVSEYHEDARVVQAMAWPPVARSVLPVYSVPSVTMHLYTLAASSSLAFPLANRLFAHFA